MKIKLLALVLCLYFASHGYSQTIVTFDTDTASEWTVNAGGAVDATPYVIQNYPEGNPSANYNFLSVTNTGDGTGTFLQEGSLANFSGFWTADYTFTLPSTATAISLSYSNFFADDRAVMMLNGQIIDSTGIISIVGAPGSRFLLMVGASNPIPSMVPLPLAPLAVASTSEGRIL